LLRRHGVIRGGLGPVDMELRRLQRRRHCDLHSVARDSDSDSDTNSDTNATHGVIFGKSGQHDLWRNLDRDLVLDQRNLMHRVGRVERDEGDQRYPYGSADKHYDLHAELHRD